MSSTGEWQVVKTKRTRRAEKIGRPAKTMSWPTSASTCREDYLRTISRTMRRRYCRRVLDPTG